MTRSATAASTPTANYRVDGMSCEHCVRAVTEEVSALPGVASLTLDLASGTLTVVGAVDADAVGAAVAQAGYDLER